ncbi:MAG: S9 family peptidase [Oligoflexus sp.]|nr:S9 family peptidase [Oligoflexus sp.]
MIGRIFLILAGLFGVSFPLSADTGSLFKMVSAPVAPLMMADPTRTTLLLIERDPTIPLESLAIPAIGLAGNNLDPALWSARRRSHQYAPSFSRLSDGKKTAINIPSDSNVTGPRFSPDGSLLALGTDGPKGIEVWIVTVATGKAHKVEGLLLNDNFVNRSYQWSSDSKSLLVSARVSNNEKFIQKNLDAPTIEETLGTKVQARSYPYLLKTKADIELFKKAANAQIYKVDAASLKKSKVGKPASLASFDLAPNDKDLLVKTFSEPFSFAVVADDFALNVEVWNQTTGVVKNVLKMPLAESVPPEGVRTGPRFVTWQAGHASRLIWVEALDDGDPRQKVPHRDRLMTWDAPFVSAATERFRMLERFSDMMFMPKDDQLLIMDTNRDSFQVQINFVDFASSAKARLLLDYNSKDVYKAPGSIVTQSDAKGDSRVVMEGESLFLSSRGLNPNGERPFLDKFDIHTAVKDRVFESDDKSAFVESFSFFYGRDTKVLTIGREAPAEPANLWTLDRSSRARRQLTFKTDNVPEMTGAIKKPLVYQRRDGLTLSGTLYLPKDYKEGTKLPAVIWAYPEEFRTKESAGQVRVSDKRYSRPSPIGITWLVTQGYAVLDNAAMPVIGEKETGNDSFVTQTVQNAEAAVDALDKLGVIDRKRVAIGGHSYGAFMTASLLTHTQLFCAGVARSGAYNRSLTPFGFQAERRTFWEAKDFYMSVSPFSEADKIKTPLLMIHGKDDNNPGTLTMQSERMFQAVRGTGGKARLVLLPYESHGYTARENVELTHLETLNWLSRWCGPQAG